jgi:cell division septation protein DedD
VAELTHDAADDGFHEIQLSGKQLAFLVMMTMSGLVLTFLLGVQVGRGVRAERGEEPMDSAAAATAAPVDTGASAAPAEPPAPTPETPLSYPDRLSGAPPAETLKPQAETPDPAPEPAAPPPAAETTPAPAAAPPAAAATRASANVPTSGRPGRWVVQVISLKNRAGAAEITQQLIGKGYPAFMLPPPSGTPTLYRVQIGRYNDRGEADRVARRLTREDGYKPEVKR